MSNPTPLPSDTRLQDHVIATIARTGRCYTNEARAMASEIIERRSVRCTHQGSITRVSATGGTEIFCPRCDETL